MDDRELLRQFETCTLPFEQWDHRIHLRIAFLYLRDHGFDGALKKIRSGIKAYNAANKVPDEEFLGYNETTTHAFLRLVDATMRAYGDTFQTPDSESFCDTHTQLLSRNVLRFFYSPARRCHPEAKARFVAPDLAPLPDVNRCEST